MAEYKGIKGFKVQTVSTDPAASIGATGSWASSTNLNTARAYGGGTPQGTQNAALFFAGNNGTADVANNESYNGTTWTELADLNTARRLIGGIGTQTAALAFGGNPPVTGATEEWNGTSWVEGDDLSTARYAVGGFGIQTEAVAVGGSVGPPTYSDSVEYYNGTSWTAGTATPVGWRSAVGAGTEAAGLIFSGQNPALTTDALKFNGSTWTATGSLNTARSNASGTGGTQDSALAFGGETPSITGITEFFDGSTWTEVADLATARYLSGGSGSNTSGLCSGGDSGSVTAATEEWTTTPAPTFQQENLGQVFYNSTSDAFKVTQQPVPGGTWSAGGNLNTARTYSGASGLGTQTDSLLFGGRKNSAPASNKAETEKYDGTSWTEVNDLPAAKEGVAGFGTTTNAVSAGGGDSPAVSNPTCTWDGTNWTEVNEINTARNKPKGAGTYTAGLIFSGQPYPSVSAATEEWDGTNWTSGGQQKNGQHQH
jgi:hypothetical protein